MTTQYAHCIQALNAYILKLDYLNRQFLREVDNGERFKSIKLNVRLNIVLYQYAPGYWTDYMEARKDASRQRY